MIRSLAYTNEIHTSSFEIGIAKWYVFSLPFRLFNQLAFLKSIFGVCANYLPFVFHVLGLFVWLYNEGGKYRFGSKSKLLKMAGILVIYLNLSSLIMACIIQIVYGNHGSENAFQGVAGMIVYFTQYFLMFLYNYRVFRLLSIETVNKLLHKACLVLLAIGYFQILVMNGIGSAIYDALNIFGVLNPSTMLPKLCLTGIEGATAGCIIGVFVLPFLFSKIIEGDRRFILEVLLWLLPLYYTNSSSAYLLFAVDFLLLIFLLITQSSNPKRGWRMLGSIIALAALSIVICFAIGIFDEGTISQIRYNLFVKPIAYDSNGSTTSRTVPLLVNWGAFKEFPVLGVGNGLQGYFYEKYFPDWAFSVAGSDVGTFLSRSKEGIANGGVFIPSLLSGYGIIGCALIIRFVVTGVRETARNRFKIGNYYVMFIIAGIAFFVMGFQGDAYGLYFAWFMLSIPFVAPSEDHQH